MKCIRRIRCECSDFLWISYTILVPIGVRLIFIRRKCVNSAAATCTHFNFAEKFKLNWNNFNGIVMKYVGITLEKHSLNKHRKLWFVLHGSYSDYLPYIPMWMWKHYLLMQILRSSEFWNVDEISDFMTSS